MSAGENRQIDRFSPEVLLRPSPHAMAPSHPSPFGSRQRLAIYPAINIWPHPGEITQSDITDIKSARRSMTTIRGAGKDNQGRQLKRLVSASTVNRTLQWLRAALYHVRDHHEAFLRPLKFSLTTEPQRVREATPEEERVLVRHLRDDYHPIFLYARE